MSEPTIRFPITCPKCANELIVEFPVAVIASDIAQRNSIRLHAICHDVSWDASPLELEQIREYLGAMSERTSPLSRHSSPGH